MREDGHAEDVDDLVMAVDDEDWEATMGEVSHTPAVGDPVPEIWNRGEE